MPITFNRRTNYFPPPAVVGGWTDPVASGDTVKVHVSDSTGNDTTGTGAVGAPYKTLARGKADLRPGFPDWLLLKRGDTFDSQRFGDWVSALNVPLSGRNASERMVIGTYGVGARPIVQTGVNTGLRLESSLVVGAPVSNLYVLGISFLPGTAGVNDIYALGIYGWPGRNIHIEDCKFNRCRVSIGLYGNPSPSVNVVIRRNVIIDPQDTQYQDQAGINIVRANLVLIEQNIIDGIQADRGGIGEPFLDTLQPEGIRVHTSCTSVTISENVVSNVGFAGISTKASATIKDNVVFQCPRGIAVGPHPYRNLPQEFSGPITVSVTGNLVKDSVNDSTAYMNAPPVGFQITGVSNSTWSQNIWSGSAVAGVRPFWVYGMWPNDPQGGRINGVTLFANKIVGTDGTLLFESRYYDNAYDTGDGTVFYDPWGGIDQVYGLVLDSNDIQLTSSGEIVKFYGVTEGVFDHVSSTGNRFWGTSSDAGHEWYRMIWRVNPSTFYPYPGQGPGDLARWHLIYEFNSGFPQSTEVQLSYPGAAYTLGTYHVSVGGADSTAALVTALRAQSRAAWNDALMAIPIRNYFRTGYTA